MALWLVSFWFASKSGPLKLISNTILFNRAKVATSSEELAKKIELTISAEWKSELVAYIKMVKHKNSRYFKKFGWS